MAQRKVAASTTAAIVAPNQVPFLLNARDFKYGKPVVSVTGLATSETITFYIKAGTTWLAVADSAGTPISFTATYQSDIFNGPGEYGYIKDATAGAIALYVDSGI